MYKRQINKRVKLFDQAFTEMEHLSGHKEIFDVVNVIPINLLVSVGELKEPWENSNYINLELV